LKKMLRSLQLKVRTLIFPMQSISWRIREIDQTTGDLKAIDHVGRTTDQGEMREETIIDNTTITPEI